MTAFWLAAAVLLLAALAFLLIPLLRGRRAQAEEDRTALNVALYQERIAELDAQHAAGSLDAAQLEAGRSEAARELLDDAEQAEAARRPLGRWLPLTLAVLVPVAGLALYLHWGASDALKLREQLAVAPKNMDEVIARLEETVRLQPDQAEAWYFLGRSYMAQQRPGDAAPAFARAAELAGRQPELLGQWAQALYFAEGQKFTEQVRSLGEEALRLDPQEVTTLGLLGIAAFEEQRYGDAMGYWQRLVAVLEPNDPSRQAIEGGIERAREQLVARGEKVPEAPVAPAAVELKVRVSLAPELAGKVQPDDTLFVFARAASGPPMPLAAKRLKVSDLPVEVSLSDADAMMPQLKLSNFAEIQLVARISRAGSPMQGEWIGQSGVLKTLEAGEQALVIDKAEQP
ncbi:Cytochrome c-type biogenesis protein CycH [Pseudomonas sp. OF001]|jgi:cytochrome c-type biogenesis protein CcmH|uniref:c-type cytochrome biogenesis protein CcmI n=1 Tax=unclassified Pseudomonas TaxID=196821 RepID=UPI0010A6958D|nr:MULTISPECIES: c-type cytochrome biogenesis protein CcmI [unclassified Pseudomonas]THG87264.1 c-type cytochrome biogenesis protein CcmI [Pseudomonas sp. A-1]CAD5378670.1 Cytochrome c-type biogenesis protein CycH [Pseudomonas sp. OF001]